MNQTIKPRSKNHKKAQIMRDLKPGSNPDVPFPHAMEVVLRNNQHNRQMAKYSLFTAIGALIIMFLSVTSLMYVVTRPVEVLSYAADDKGHIIPMQPVRNPTLTDAHVLNWASSRVVDLHSFTFNGWRKEIQALSPYFIDEAYTNFIAALKDTSVIKKISNEKLLVTAVPSRAPIIVAKKIVNGVYTWRVELPIIQTIEGGNTASVNNNLLVTMVIQRVPRTETLDGIKIRSYLVKEGSH